MQNNHTDNAHSPSATGDSDVLSAIEAAAAEIDDPHTHAAGDAQKKPESEKTAPQSIKVQHEHGGEIDGEEYDAMLNQAFEDRENMLTRRKKIRRLCSLVLLLGLTGSSYAWYASSPENQAKVHGLWSETKTIAQDVKDGTDVVKIMDDYDAALDKVAVRGDQVRDASISLGQDPENDDAESRAQLAKQMKWVTGDERTAMDRDAQMQKRFGKFAKEQRAKIEAERARKKAEEEEKASR